MLPTLASTLGFTFTTFGHKKETAIHHFDTSRGINSMYVYANVVEPVIVGNVKVPLLGVVPVTQKVKERESTTSLSTPPIYPWSSILCRKLRYKLMMTWAIPWTLYFGERLSCVCT